MKLANSRVHFIGIGGIGMSGLAELLHNMGASVSGSDISQNQQTQSLEALGIKVLLGHKPDHIKDVDVVVFTSAVKADNPEMLEARRRKIPLIARAEALAEIMLLKRGVAIAGTHGKTTTTSIAASVFIKAQVDPTIVVGGRLDLIKSTAKLGSGEWLVAEADESDGSFTRLSPEIVIITNIDDDHMDHYQNMKNLKKAFWSFASRIPFYGSLIVCGDDPQCWEVFQEFPKKISFYGFDERNDYQLIKNVDQSYKIKHEGKILGQFKLSVPGDHNALNALAALISGLDAGFELNTCIQGVESYSGVDRRFQKKGHLNGIDVYDDYGHHPTEVKAVLKAFKSSFPNRRLVIAFQPHRYSRTEQCWNDFLSSFSDADELFVFDIYPAGESPIAGIDSQKLCQAIDHNSCHFVGGESMAEVKLFSQLKPGDVLVTLGAGTIFKVGEKYLVGEK